MKKELKEKNYDVESVKIPKDYLRSPIFASSKQKSGRKVIIKKFDRIYEIGGFETLPGTEKPCPALDIRHGRVLFTMLTFHDRVSKDSFDEHSHRIRFSLTQFCKRYARSINYKGGSNVKAISKLLNDLMQCWFKVTYSNGEKKIYRILKDITIHCKANRRNQKSKTTLQDEVWLDEVELHPEFYGLLNDYTELGLINLKVLTSIRSPLAQCIYAYMPSRIVSRTEEDPFSINLLTILTEVGHNAPKHKSLRKQLFIQNRNSIIKQLDGLAFSQGTLRVKMIETEDKSDYKLLFWNSEIKILNKDKVKTDANCPKLRKYWLKSGRHIEIFNQKIKNNASLESYQEELLERAQIRLKGNEKFMKTALNLLGRSNFDEQVSEVKSMVLEPNVILRDPTKVFISQVCKALSKHI